MSRMYNNKIGFAFLYPIIYGFRIHESIVLFCELGLVHLRTTHDAMGSSRIPGPTYLCPQRTTPLQRSLACSYSIRTYKTLTACIVSIGVNIIEMTNALSMRSVIGYPIGRSYNNKLDKPFPRFHHNEYGLCLPVAHGSSDESTQLTSPQWMNTGNDLCLPVC